MRLIMTEEMQKLWNEIKPYYDSSYNLCTDTPDDIRQKVEKFHKLQDIQYEEAMKIELGLV